MKQISQVTYEELRYRLHKGIEMLHGKSKNEKTKKKNDSLKQNWKSKYADPDGANGEVGAPTAKRPKVETKAALVNSHFITLLIFQACAYLGCSLGVFNRCGIWVM